MQFEREERFSVAVLHNQAALVAAQLFTFIDKFFIVTVCLQIDFPRIGKFFLTGRLADDG